MSLKLGIFIILLISGFFPESQRALAECQGVNDCFNKLLKSHRQFVKASKTEKLKFYPYKKRSRQRKQMKHKSYYRDDIKFDDLYTEDIGFWKG
ncbi:unnamed protein product, partial [Iphiclides podalirius]